jgi:type IV secretion system protein VirB10
MSAIIAGVSMSQPNNSNSYNGQVNARDALSEALGQSLGMTMSQMIQKNLNISPTLEIRPGYRFNVMAVKDLVFKRPYMAFDYSQKGGWK